MAAVLHLPCMGRCENTVRRSYAAGPAAKGMTAARAGGFRELPWEWISETRGGGKNKIFHMPTTNAGKATSWEMCRDCGVNYRVTVGLSQTKRLSRCKGTCARGRKSVWFARPRRTAPKSPGPLDRVKAEPTRRGRRRRAVRAEKDAQSGGEAGDRPCSNRTLRQPHRARYALGDRCRKRWSR